MKRTPPPPLGRWPWIATAAAARRVPLYEMNDDLSQAERQRVRQNRRPRPIDRTRPRDHGASPSFPVNVSDADSANTDDGPHDD
jgi:hypothetical protein